MGEEEESEHTRPELQSKGAPGAGEGEALIFLFSPLIHFSRKRGGEKAKIDPFLFLCVRMCVILAIRLGEKSVGSFSHTRKNILRTPFLFLYQLLYSEV